MMLAVEVVQVWLRIGKESGLSKAEVLRRLRGGRLKMLG